MTARRRVLRAVLGVSLAGATAVGISGISWRAHASTPLLGWTAQADANAFDFVIDDAAGLAGVHPLSEADLPETNSDFETGPFGHALASVFWPGATAGNAGSLAGELPLPAQLAPLFDNLNDPVKAETFFPSGPATASYPAGPSTGVAQMTSSSNENGESAKAGLADVSVPGLFEIKGAHGSTTATATSTAQSTASTSFSDLSLLAGLIDIGATTSTASANSDGVSPSGKSVSHIGAITVAGHAVSVGSDGLVIGPAQTNILGPLLAPTEAQVQQLVSLLQLKIIPLPATETHDAPAEKVVSAGLQVSFTLPSSANLTLDCSAIPPQLSQLTVICTLPGLLQGASFTATIGRVTATAVATPPFDDSVPSSPPSQSPSAGASDQGSTAGVPVASAGSTDTGSAASPDLASAGGPGTSATGPYSSSAPAAPGGPSTGAGPTGSLVPVSLSTPVRAGLLGFLLFLAAVTGAALVRMSRALDAPLPTACPLEERP